MKKNQKQDQRTVYKRNGQLVLALNSEMMISENAPLNTQLEKANIRIELFLLALVFDLKKLWMTREQGRLQTHVSMKMTS